MNNGKLESELKAGSYLAYLGKADCVRFASLADRGIIQNREKLEIVLGSLLALKLVELEAQADVLQGKAVRS